MADARWVAFDLLTRTERDGAYSNLLLDRAFTATKLSDREKAFAAALFYGVLERRLTLDYLIRAYSRVEFDRLEPSAIRLLRLGFYQLLFMEGVPDRAALNETVALAPPRQRGFINAVLRAFQRDGGTLKLDGLTGEARLSVEYSCPKWLVKMWTRRFGEEITRSLLEASLGRPPLFIKVNTLRASVGELIEALSREGIAAKPNALLPDCAELGRVSGIEKSRAYRDGLFHVQDISSQLCCSLVDPKPGETVLDLCAAPGGKSFTLAEKMGDKGRLLAFDLHSSKLPLISEGARRLGLTILSASQNDASVYNEAIPMADKVLCDAVCSGLGVIRRKPEIKYKPKATLESFPPLQRAILATAKRYVKPGGVLVYSTCTLNEAENEAVAADFLRDNADFTLAVEKNFFPHETGGDGFFAAVFRRGNGEKREK
ncbi:MAG: 16S rRNA (cytosine(967)-C(5))-methyltransferase RsmB [Bacteroides sp.]|nr:16S rRNA (cytosine(967)-C(5))-methyltransferase RsmB [Eubacterium sp.]MCM1417945.1 16S rRNA (cytosine(967)-C(5))-methyltransferase RsmB [Roseburia sp.]MCM1461808.1 16S rRNA (cytosine(967)-C(5))-methyltransferase RsmB [Bacteroides sp.]